MASDRSLSGNFALHEFEGWERASETQVEALQETVARVLQPIRNRFGRVRPTSWLYWSDGTPRTGAHAQGGTVDFVTPDADLWEVFEWGKTYLLPSGFVGRWIYEPHRTALEGAPQGEHIHMAPRGDMLAYNGDGRIQALEETDEGRYVLHSEYVDGLGTELNPYQVAGVTTQADGRPWLWIGILILAWGLNLAGQAVPRS